MNQKIILALVAVFAIVGVSTLAVASTMISAPTTNEVEYVDTTLPAMGPNGESWMKTDTLDIIGTTSVVNEYPYVTLR